MASVCADGNYFEVTDDGELTIKPGVQGMREILYFKEPGTFQFRKGDYPWLARIRVRVQAGGGGSAGANAANNECITRPGGAGGGYSESVIDAADLGTVESVVVGVGGSPGGGNAPGGAGGNSSFGGLVIAEGGSGGTANQTSGTSAVTAQGVAAPFAGSGDFVSGGGAGHGSIRLTATQGLSGAGGESMLGHGGYPRTTDGPGSAPRGFGAGAGGSFSAADSQPGHEGGGGVVIIQLYG
ncbi:hypothetical protein [Streptomyces sulphureus]|uniref:hypothetical protein n=1 Tax=Streptomyces sulphureus TaxID=47758 RepID=UPI00036E530A|nr:hypothetical protein [Streptomyces sulphureus]